MTISIKRKQYFVKNAYTIPRHSYLRLIYPIG
nr:MAG TPA: hypothetical protein [Caudoviricetes sp.]